MSTVLSGLFVQQTRSLHFHAVVFLLLRLLAAKMSLQRRDDADELLVAAPQQREQLLLRELEQPLLEGQDLRVSH